MQRAEVTPKTERIKTAMEFLQSGMTMVAWSRERQINRFTLHNWIEEYRRETKTGNRNCEWMELNIAAKAEDIIAIKEVAQEQTAPAYTPFRISIGNSQIEVTTSFDEAALSAVIKAVKCQC